MPQKYHVELPSGEKFEIEEPDHKTHALKSIGTGVVKGAGDVTGVTPIVNAGMAAKETAPDILGNIKSGAQGVGKTLMEFGKGAIESPMAQMIAKVANPALAVASDVQKMREGTYEAPTLKDLQAQVDPGMDTADPWEANARRATNVLGLMAGGKLLKGKAPSRPKPALGPRALLPAVTDTATETAARVNTQELADRTAGVMASAKTPPTPVLGSRLVKGGQPASRPGVVPQILDELKRAGASAPDPTTQLPPPPFSQGAGAPPQQPRVNVLRGKAETPHPMPRPTPNPEVSPRAIETGNPNNAAMKAEAAQEAQLAGRTQPPGTEPSYHGTERRGAERAPNPELDRLMTETRARMTAKLPTNPEAAITVPEGPQIASPSLPLDALEDALAANRPGKGGVVRRGYDTPPGEPSGAGGVPSLRESGGRPGNVLKGAQKAKGPSPEVQARLDAGESLGAIATDLRDKLGSKRAAQQMGMTPDEVKTASGGSPSRIPANAVDKIKASLSAKVESGSLTPQEQALWDRIKSERGAIDLKKLLVAGGGTVGGAIGASLNDNGDPTSDQALAKTALGILGGTALSAFALNPATAAKTALGLRREGMLSGLAIPKNLGTALGATGTAAIEGTGTTRLSPLKEMLRLPTNTKNFLGALNTPAYAHQQTYSSPVKALGKFAPTRVIGAIDDTAVRALKRAGVPQDEIEKLLLTKDRSLLSGWKLSPGAKAIADEVIPFQRVPANVPAEGFEKLAEFGKWKGSDRKLASKALTLAAPAVGYGIGSHADTPQQKMLATLALTMMGPRTALGAMGMAIPAGRSAAAGISPIPDWAFDPKTMTGWPPSLWSTLKKAGVVK